MWPPFRQRRGFIDLGVSGRRNVFWERPSVRVAGSLLLLLFFWLAFVWFRPPPAEVFHSPDVVKTQYLDVPNVRRVAYWKVAATAPKSAAFPMIYLEGGPGIGISKPTAQRFAARYPDFDIFFLDQIGVGASDRLPKKQITLANNVAAIRLFSEDVVGQKAVFVGGSWGAAIAARFAIQHPDRVSALLLSAPAALPKVCIRSSAAAPPDCFATSLPRIDASIAPYPIQRIAVVGGLPSKTINRSPPSEIPNGRFFPRLNRLLLADLLASSFPTLSTYLVPLDERPKWEEDGLSTEVNIEISQQHMETKLNGTHEALPLPALILRGDLDWISIPQVGGYQLLFPKARFVELQNETHHIEYDGCAAVIEARTFLAKHAGAAAPKSCVNKLVPVPNMADGYTLETELTF
jgi:pimeloyl-ACP methyl ester carboxylesterase